MSGPIQRPDPDEPDESLAGRTGGAVGDPGKKPDSKPGQPRAGASAANGGSNSEQPRGGRGGSTEADAAVGGPRDQDDQGDQGGQGGDGAEPDEGGSGGSETEPDAGTAGGPAGGAGGAGGSGAPVEPEAGSGGQTGGQGGQTGGQTGGQGGQTGGQGGAGSSAPPPGPTGDRTYLSQTDRSAEVVLSSDRLSAEWLGLADLGVRSTRAVSSGEGVFYFEAYADVDLFGIGVAPASANLARGAASGGGFGIDVSGIVEAQSGAGQTFSRSTRGEYGFVVDYRGASPTVYLIAGTSSSARFIASRTLSITQPLYIHLSGLRRKQGPQATINPGNDTTNQPFVFDPRAVLQSAGFGDVASALVLGWGETHTGTWNEPPSLSFGSTPPSSLNVGDTVTLTASASDAEGGVGSGDISWDVLSAGIGSERIHATGGSFTFTPSVIGRHPIQISVTDAGGKTTQRSATIEARGTLAAYSTVKLTAEPGLSGNGIGLSSDGLRAKWTIDQKLGVRANQGLYGDFWYVEGHRLVPEDNQAIGLVIGGVSLNPYVFNTTPPSCSVNTTGPSVFRDLMYAQSTARTNVEYYGLAVDYRGSYPIAHVIIGGALATSLHLTDVTVPVYPMLYGNVNSHGASYDMEINFGGSSFHEDPRAVLSAAGVDSSALKLCWGSANSACR